MPPVNDVGEPCAGEPHARFDGEGLETKTPDHGSECRDHPGNQTVAALPAYRHHGVPRASPSPNRYCLEERVKLAGELVSVHGLHLVPRASRRMRPTRPTRYRSEASPSPPTGRSLTTATPREGRRARTIACRSRALRRVGLPPPCYGSGADPCWDPGRVSPCSCQAAQTAVSGWCGWRAGS